VTLPSGGSFELYSVSRDMTQLSFGPLASLPIEIDYSPTRDGKLSGSLVFLTNHSKSKRPGVTVRLTGSGVGTPPVVTANPPSAMFLGDVDGSDNVYTDFGGHSGDSVIGPGPVPNSSHYGGVTIPLKYTIPGHNGCSALILIIQPVTSNSGPR